MNLRRIVVFVLLLACASWCLAAKPLTLVVCAPGYPGNTEQAQPTMDALAAAVNASSGTRRVRIEAVYHESVEGGLARLEDERSAVALVSLPFYLEYHDELALEPLLRVDPAAGDDEQWSLVARRGALPQAGSLAGWQLASLAAYAPRFVSDVALAGWGTLPEDVEISFTPRVMGKLRRAARGDSVAVLLDKAQTEAMSSLSFAEELEVVASSQPMLASVLCSVGGRLDEAGATALSNAFLSLNDSDSGAEVLESIRVSRVRELDPAILQAAERAYDGG